MTRLIAGRLLTAAGLLILLSVVVIVGVDLLPGDPVTSRLSGVATAERIAQAQARLGLDRPVGERYLDWAGGLIHGDLGVSASGAGVTDLLTERLANSALLAGLAVLVLIPVSLLIGITAGLRSGSRLDRGISAGSLLLVALPEFVLAGTLVLIFAIGLRWLPAVSLVPSGTSPLRVPEVLVLPVLSLLLLGLASSVRLIRASTASAVQAPHVEFLRLNGIAPRTVLRQAVLPAVLPVAVQVWLLSAVGLVGGAVLVEKVFGYPGIGDLLVRSVQTGDLPVVQGLAMILGAAMLLAVLLADVATRAMTPVLRTANP